MTTPDPNTRRVPQADPESTRAYDDVLHCNRCGFCTSFCPTYLATGDEGLSPRGRNQAWRALLENRLDPVDGSRFFDTCLLCGICTDVCFARVPTATLMSEAREKVLEARGAPRLLRLLLRKILPFPSRFEPLLKALFLLKRLGLSGLLNRLGVLRLLSPRLAAAEEVLERPPARFLRELLPPAPRDAEVVQFLACGPNLLAPEVGLATARLLKVKAARAGSAGNVCCGLAGQSLGDREAARDMARRNIEILEGFPRAVILVDDSSCAAAVKGWPELLMDEPGWRDRALAVAARTRDLLEWMAGQDFAAAPAAPARVTYHDACKARYGQGLVREPRGILRSVPGFQYVELPESDQCCGGGGTYQFVQPDLSAQVGDRKARNVEGTGAGLVFTSAVSCLLQLRARLRRAGSKVKAFHIAQLWDQHL